MVPDFVAPEPPRYLGLWSREQVARLDAARFDPIRIFDWSLSGDGARTAGEVVPDSISVGDPTRGCGEPGEPENGVEHRRIGYNWDLHLENAAPRRKLY